MRVRLLMDCPGPNPQFDRRRKASPDNPREVIVPKGTELEGQYCWIHCRPDAITGVVRAEPIDDEAVARVSQDVQRRTEIEADRARRAAEEAAEKQAKKTTRRQASGR